MPEEMPNIEGGSPTPPEASSSAEKPVSQRSFREVFALEKRLEKQRETSSSDALSRVETELAEASGRKNQLIGEVEQEGGLMGLNQELSLLKDMLDAGQLSPSHLFDATRAIPQLDNLAGLEPSDPHVGVREWYYRKNLDEITKDLREQKGQALGGQRKQPRAQLQSAQPLVSQQGQISASSNAASTKAEKEVFGEGEAFSDRWVKARGIPTIVQYYRSRFGTEEEDDDIDLNSVGSSPGTFKPSELFTTILETGGRDPRSGRMLSYLLENYPGDSKKKEIFSSALVNGFLTIASLKDALNSGRIDTLAEALRRGPPPQGIAQWLIFDPETRRSLALIVKLEGYAVAGEVGANGVVIQDNILGLEHRDKKGKTEYYLPSVGWAFSDHQHIRPDQIKTYLEAIQKTVGTDPGVVKLAYYIFRVLGHPQENYKFSQELVKKYMFIKGVKDEKFPNRDLAPEDIASFLLKFDDPTKSRKDEKDKDKETNVYYKLPVKPWNESGEDKNKVFLEDVLEKEGVIGFALSLNKLPAEKIVREWSDMQLILDMMDQISDIRAGLGAGSSLGPSERLKAIRSVKEFGIALAKRKLSQETVDRLVDTSKIAFTPGSTEVSFWEKTLHGMKAPIGGLGKGKPKVR